MITHVFSQVSVISFMPKTSAILLLSVSHKFWKADCTVMMGAMTDQIQGTLLAMSAYVTLLILKVLPN